MGRPRTRDDLTGLALRAAFNFDFQQLRRSTPASLLLCDLDHLKIMNDTLGHLAGDEALRQLSAALRQGLLPGWRAYRLGGDEFAVLARTSAEQLSEWAQAVLLSLRQQRPPISVSVGVAAVPGAGAELDEVVSTADRRLYAAKRLGKAQVVSEDWPSPFETPQFRLLEREHAAHHVTHFLQQALVQPGEVQVRAAPGGGLSAFLRQMEVVARTLGYQTLRLSGSAARQCQQFGAWHHASLDGQPLAPGAELEQFTGGPRPLALILDTPGRFDAATTAALERLLGSAQAVVRGQAELGAEASGAVVLEPLSAGALEALLGRPDEQPGPATRQWLWARAGGLPAPTYRWWRALNLEAALRCESSAEQMVLAENRDWETATARHFTPALDWPRPVLYGRQSELADALQRLRRAPLLTITGPPGRGKTRFAEQLLGELGEQFASVHSVSLSGSLDAASALSRLSEALLGQPSTSADSASVGRLLARQPTLLLLDAQQEAHLSAGLLEALLAHNSLGRIIVTAQAPLGAQQESVLALGLLPSEAVSAALGSVSRTPELAALTDWVAGEPLRLEVACALLRSVGAEQGLERLSRQDSLEGTTAAALLGEYECRALAALAGARGPFDLSWAEALSGASPFLLGALRDQHYFQAMGSGLYRVSGSLARSSERHWKRSPPLRRRVRRRALDQLGGVLDAYPRSSAAWFLHLDQHHASVRSVVAGFLSGRSPVSAEVAGVLLSLLPYRLARGYLHDARAELDLALRRGAALGPDLLHQLRLASAQVHQHLGDHPAAQAALSGLPRQGCWQAQTALIEARILHRRSLYKESHALFTLVGRLESLAPDSALRALDGQARSAIYLGELDEAAQLIEQALAQAFQIGDELLLSEVLNTAALIATEQRRLDRAGELFGRALEIHQAFSHHAGLTLNQTGLAWISLLQGDCIRSAELSRQVLRRAEDAGNAWEIANALINLGHALAHSGQLQQARAAQLRGAQLALQSDAPSLVAEALGGLAEVLCREGEVQQARLTLKAALTHSGANAEMRQFFAPLTERLQPFEAQLGPLDTLEQLLR